MKSKKMIVIASVAVAIIAVASICYFIFVRNSDTQKSKNQLQTTQAPEGAGLESLPFDKSKYSIDQPGSIWWIVNKNRPLPEGYVPPDLIVPVVKLRLGNDAEQMKFSGQAEIGLNEMFMAAQKDGIVLVFGSGYRSYELQQQFYSSYVLKDGQAAADRYSAKPGTSEHQTGLSFDVTNVGEKCHLEICFANTPEGQWVENNAYKYGFIVRYPEGKEEITGYQYEPWHLRYVGGELAAELKKTGQTMEEYFGVN